jgi:MFS family permease
MTAFPVGLHNAFLFSGFNALSFQIVLSSPMVLYAKTLGASATILGIIAGMMPLLVIFQIPAANYISRVGFKRFVYAGWGTRVLFIFAMALVPLTGRFLDAQTRLVLILALLCCFNISRGISSCAWLPWITLLVPATLRGKYLSRDAGVQNTGSFITFLVAAVTLAGEPRPFQFAILFAFSGVMGAISLAFLKRIPDAAMPEEIKSSKNRVPWLSMIKHPPFKRLLWMVFGYSTAYGGMTAFTVAFLRAEAGLNEGTILLISAVAYLGGLSSLWFLGSGLDRLGSKPVLAFSLFTWVLVMEGWVLLAGGAFAPRLSIVLALQFFMGLLWSLVTMSNTRLAMVIVPVMGRNHFFAIFSVVLNLSLGLSPILWGLVIDAVGKRRGMWLGVEWNRYTVFFAAVSLLMLVALGLARRLEEPEAASMEDLLRDILIHSPQRALVRLWSRE